MSLLARVSILGALALGIAACATSGFYAAKIRPPVLSRFAEVSESQSFLTGSKKGMVVSDDKKAGDWGIEILKKGGNAMDAAIATAFALSVSRPQFASMGGGRNSSLLSCAQAVYRH